MNVGYNELNVSDVATMLGVQKCTVHYWCRAGYIKCQDVSNSGSSLPRYLFDVDEVNKVNKLRDKYGKNWIHHINNEVEEPVKPVSTDDKVYGITNPEEYIPDNCDEIYSDIKKYRALVVQRDKLLAEVDSLEEAIRTLRAKVIESL